MINDTRIKRTRNAQRNQSSAPPEHMAEGPEEDTLTSTNDQGTVKILAELAKLRKEITVRDKQHQEELQKIKAEFSAALAGVKQELEDLRERVALPQLSSETCTQSSHEEILRELQSLRSEVTTPDTVNENPPWTEAVTGTGRTHPNPWITPFESRKKQTKELNCVRVSTQMRGDTEISGPDILYCTIDTSKMAENDKMSAGPIRTAVEKGIRAMDNHGNWRCRAVTVDPRNTDRIKIACRDRTEHELVKQVAEARIGPGARVLRDELYPIKIDSVKRTAVLDENDKIRAGAAEAFSEENETTVAKIIWLSNRESYKAYGSMVVYLTKGSDAMRLLADGFFHAGGESGVTSAFEHRPRPAQCYNCQEMGHKAFQCKNTQKCAKCAKESHHHSNCTETVLKCIPCGGPHESFSKKCRMLYPLQHE